MEQPDNATYLDISSLPPGHPNRRVGADRRHRHRF